jgi:hypothetical protein
VHLIDTPGFDDTTRSDTEVFGEIAGALSILYESNIPIIGMVYMHRISDTKMSGAAIKSLRIFEKLCGATAFPRVILASSMWDRMKNIEGGIELAKSREKWLSEKQEFWGNMIREGARKKRFRADTPTARKIVDALMANARPIVLEVQREMINERCTLEQTTAGRYVNEELNLARKRQESELEELRIGLQEAFEFQDEALVQELSQQKKECEERMAVASAQVHNLRANFDELADTGSESYIKLRRQLEEEMEDQRARSKITVEEESPELESHRRYQSDRVHRTSQSSTRQANNDTQRQTFSSATQYEEFIEPAKRDEYTITVSMPAYSRRKRVSRVGMVIDSLFDVLGPSSRSSSEFVVPAGSRSTMALEAARVAASLARSRTS